MKRNHFLLSRNIIADAGAYGFGDENFHTAKLFGAVITKTITNDPIELQGIPDKKVPCGRINSNGLNNPGITQYVSRYHTVNKLPKIVSIFGQSKDEYISLGRMLNSLDCAGIEMNISCPDIEHNLTTPIEICRACLALRKVTSHPLILRVSPYIDYYDILKEILYSNRPHRPPIDAIHIGNVQPVAYARNKRLVHGGLSGKCLKPAAVKATQGIYQLQRLYPHHWGALPVIASGGVNSRKDVQDFMTAGADYVAVDTKNPIKSWWLTR